MRPDANFKPRLAAARARWLQGCTDQARNNQKRRYGRLRVVRARCEPSIQTWWGM